MARDLKTWICSGCGTEFNNRSQLPPQGWRFIGVMATQVVCGDCGDLGHELAEPDARRAA